MLALVFLAALEAVVGKKMTGWAGPSLEPALRAVRDGRQKALRIPDDELIAALHVHHPFPRNLVPTPSREAMQSAFRDLGHNALETLFFAHHFVPDDLHQPARRLWEVVNHLDELWWRILKAVEAQDLERLRVTILGDNRLAPAYWEPAVGRGPGVRESIRAAQNMQEADEAVQTLVWNCQLSLMALWDLQFRASRFSEFQAAPLFLFLMPRKKAVKPVRGRGPRDKADLPFGLLMELVTALYVRMHRTWDGERDQHFWPTRPPTPRGMVRCFPTIVETGKPDKHLAEQYKKKIDRLMSGERPLTIRALHEHTKPPPPAEKGQTAGSAIEEGLLPLLLAAHLWDARLVRRKEVMREGKKEKFLTLLQCDEVYLSFWQMHRADLQARGCDVAGGDIPWPAYLQERVAQGLLRAD